MTNDGPHILDAIEREEGLFLWHHRAETKALCSETIRHVSPHPASLPGAPPPPDEGAKRPNAARNHPTAGVSVCVSFWLDACTSSFYTCKKKLKNSGKNFFCCCCCNTNTQAVSSSVFCSSNPAVSHRVEPRWSQPVSVSVCIWVFFIIIISLQTASSLIILLTLIIRMVSVS